MKRIITSILIFMSLSQAQGQENWSYLGTSKFSNGNIVDGSQLAFLSDGTALAAFTQSSYSPPYINGSSVKYYNGTEWKQLGRSKIVEVNPSHTRIAVDNYDNIYVGVHKGMYIEVFKFQNGDWERIGDELGNVYGSAYNEFDLKLDKNGKPYIIYNRLNPTISAPTCKMFDGNNWVAVGEMDGLIKNSLSDANTLEFDENNVPYSLVTNEANAHRLELYQYQTATNSWLKLNTNAISYTDVYQAKLQIVNATDIYIAATGKYNSSSKHRPLITHYDGTNFSFIDSANVMAKTVDAPYAYDLKIHNGSIYHAFVHGDPGNGQPVDVRLERYNSASNSWELLAENLPLGSTYFGGIISLGFSNNKPVIGIDESVTETGSYKGSVLSTSNINGTENLGINKVNEATFQVYPNPFNSAFFIRGTQKGTLKVTDLNGSLLLTQSITEANTTVSTEDWQAGVYFVTIEFENNILHTSKIVK